MNLRFLLGLGLLFTGSSLDAADAKGVDFAHDVVPVLQKHCAECHGGEHSKGGFSINTRELILDAAAVEVGKAEKSRIIELISSTDPESQMPPKDRPRLSKKEQATLAAWINQGLAWEAGFSFAKKTYEPPLKPRRPALPAASEGRDHPIDRLLDAYLAQHKVPRPAPVDDATFLRRVYLDLTGLLPTPAARAEFLADERPDRRTRLIQKLLNDEVAYTEHWLTFWNDLLRNDYAGTGFITKGRQQISQWLYQSLLENKPYDQFVRELITPAPGAEGFIQGIRWRGNVNASQRQEIQFAQNLGQVFLGINLKCASCHDSFIDRWTLEETYGLAQVYATEQLELHRCDKPTGQQAKAAWLFPELGQIDANAAQPERLKQLAGLMTHPENGRFTRTIVNRLWHQMMGRGIVHPVDAMHTEPWSADLLDYLAVHFADNKYDLKKTLELICTSQAYQSQTPAATEQEGGEFVFRGPLPRRMTAEQFVDAVWQLTGAAPPKFHAPVTRPKPTDDVNNPKALMVRASLLKADELMRALGRPNRDQVVTMRPEGLTTLEAIELANGQPLADAIAKGGNHLKTRFSDSSEDLIAWAFHYALSRNPSAEEQAQAKEFLGPAPEPKAIEDFLWAIIMLPEFQLVR